MFASKLNKLFVAIVAAVALTTPVGMQSVASAHSESHHHSHHRVYWVYYRECPQHAWVCYGGYYEASEARQAMEYFRSQGYDSFFRS
jgi:hypothetical protein